MATRSDWGVTPGDSVAAECDRRGRQAVVDGCVRLIGGDYTDHALILTLGGPGAAKLLDGRPHQDVYWFRVWGVRGLLWVWDDSAVPAVTAALGDESWRVREMAAKVVARHVVGDALPAVAELRDDPVVRVRAAAERAVAVLSQADA
jgi:HEAT repeat protein